MMWVPNRVSRTDSMQSVPRAFASNRSSIYEEGSPNQKIPMWQSPKEGLSPTNRLSRTASTHSIQSIGSNRSSISADSIVEKSPPPRYETATQETRPRRESVSSEQSHSTLAEDPADIEMDAKTPTVIRKLVHMTPEVADIELEPEVPALPRERSAPAGPLEQQLMALLSKVKLIEQDQPTVMAEDHKALQKRVEALEAEKRTWQTRHEVLYSLRDEDLANLIKVRGLLAAERRAHEAMCKLREEDIKNVVALRDKLAAFTWGRRTPERSDSLRMSMRQSMREGSDLWQAAKTAALEQRLLELEHANASLKSQLEGTGVVVAKAPSASSVHPAAMGSGSLGSNVEDFLEDNMRQREKSAVKVQQLRSENEALRKEVATLEDKNSELEAKIHRLQRRA